MSANGMARPCSAIYLLSRVGRRKAKLKEHAMRTCQNTPDTINTIGIDVGKNTFHLVGLDKRGAIVLQQKVTRHQLGQGAARTEFQAFLTPFGGCNNGDRSLLAKKPAFWRGLRSRLRAPRPSKFPAELGSL